MSDSNGTPRLYQLVKLSDGTTRRLLVRLKGEALRKVEAQLKEQAGSTKARPYIKHGTRLRIFARDNYRCRICGRDANDGIKLHLDHIVPVVSGGSSDPSNLQTLCNECNIGKSHHNHEALR